MLPGSRMGTGIAREGIKEDILLYFIDVRAKFL
jgi:hypothetical protein